MRYFNSIEIVEINYNSWYSNSTVWPQRTEFIARLQCTVLSDGNVIQKHWKSSFYSFSFSFCTGFGNYFSVPHFLLLATLSFLPSFHCPSLSFSSPSFFPSFFCWQFFFSVSQSLSFYFTKLCSIKYELFKRHHYLSLVCACGFISHATYCPNKTSSFNKSTLKFYLRIKSHVVIRVLNLPWKAKKKKRSFPGLFLYCLSPLCYFLTFFYSSQVYWTWVKSQHLRTHTSFYFFC